MLDEAKELVEKFPDIYRSFDDPKEEPDQIRGYDTNSLMGLYLAVDEFFNDLVESGNETRARQLLSFAKQKLYADRPNWPSDLSTAIIIGFFKNFSREECLWQNLNLWFSADEYWLFKSEFDYLLTSEQIAYLEKMFSK